MICDIGGDEVVPTCCFTGEISDALTHISLSFHNLLRLRLEQVD